MIETPFEVDFPSPPPEALEALEAAIEMSAFVFDDALDEALDNDLDDALVDASKDQPEFEISTASQPRILIVDDEELTVAVICGHLENAGYRNLQATNDPIHALGLLEAETPDLVLLDIQMEGMNGFDVLRTIRARADGTTLPVLIVTASDDDDTRMLAFELGATDFLQKPLNRTELTARIRNVLTLKASQDGLKDYSMTLEEAVKQRTAELEASRMDVIKCLARAADFRDDDSGNHVLRVGRYARIIGREMGLANDFLEILEPAAQLHDVGKIGIPDEILLKPGKLSEDEFAYMQKHCAFGKRIITPLSPHQSNLAAEHAELGAMIMSAGRSPVLELASRIAMTHHEKWDGSGYPLGLAGTNIPIEGRITAVADVFDALSSRRPYKDPFPLERCFEILKKGKDTQFDPDCIDAFFSAIDDIVDTQIEFAETD